MGGPTFWLLVKSLLGYLLQYITYNISSFGVTAKLGPQRAIVYLQALLRNWQLGGLLLILSAIENFYQGANNIFLPRTQWYHNLLTTNLYLKSLAQMVTGVTNRALPLQDHLYNCFAIKYPLFILSFNMRNKITTTLARAWGVD